MSKFQGPYTIVTTVPFALIVFGASYCMPDTYTEIEKLHLHEKILCKEIFNVITEFKPQCLLPFKYLSQVTILAIITIVNQKEVHVLGIKEV